jgi:hypothetical protein
MEIAVETNSATALNYPGDLDQYGHSSNFLTLFLSPSTSNQKTIIVSSQQETYFDVAQATVHLLKLKTQSFDLSHNKLLGQTAHINYVILD